MRVQQLFRNQSADAASDRGLAHRPATVSWADRAYALRDRVVAHPRFQRWAASFPLTRRTAHRHARSLFDLCAGFVYSQILSACVRLRIFDVLADGPLRIDELAKRVDLDVAATTRLVNAACALGLLAERRGGRIGLAMLGAALRGNPGALAMIEHHALLYADLADPVAMLRGAQDETQLSRFWPYAAAQQAASLTGVDIERYTALMAASQSLVADDILSAYSFDQHACILDVGGGDGTFLATAAARCPVLALRLFDLPAVAERAQARLSREGYGDRAVVTGGDFSNDPLPQGADVVTLVRVLLDHTDAGALRILSGVRAALPDDGTLIIAEPMRGLAGAEPVGDAYFGFYLMAMGRGQARSRAEMQALLEATGFDRIAMIRTRRPLLTGMLKARVSKNYKQK